jgi:hypothetical protein
VRPGTSYGGFTANKGVDLDAPAGAYLTGKVILTDLPAEQWLRLRGLDIFSSLNFGASLLVRRCAGPVFLSRLKPWGISTSTEIDNCAAVLVVDCELHGANIPMTGVRKNGLSILNSRVLIQRTRCTGSLGYEGVTASGGSELVVVASSCQGGIGSDSGSFCTPPPGAGGTGIYTDGPVLIMGGSQVVAGGGGQGNGNNCPDGPPGLAILARGPSALVTADVQVSGAVQNTTTIPVATWISSPGIANLGAHPTLEYTGPRGTVCFNYMATGHLHLSIPEILGPLLITPTAAIPLPMFALGAAGRHTQIVHIPSDPVLRNVQLFFQSLAWPPNAAMPSLTNVGDLVLR